MMQDVTELLQEMRQEFGELRKERPRLTPGRLHLTTKEDVEQCQ
jgi:hypothetical protein